jgi:hypothetical protein
MYHAAVLLGINAFFPPDEHDEHTSSTPELYAVLLLGENPMGYLTEAGMSNSVVRVVKGNHLYEVLREAAAFTKHFSGMEPPVLPPEEVERMIGLTG